MKELTMHDLETAKSLVATGKLPEPNVGEKFEYMGVVVERTGAYFSGDGVRVVSVPEGFPDICGCHGPDSVMMSMIRSTHAKLEENGDQNE